VAALARGIRTLTVVAAVAIAATSCDSGGGSVAAASCAATLRFHHQVFVGTSLRTHPPYNRIGVIPRSHLHKIGVALQPPCLDTNHPSGNNTQALVQVARIDGVSPKLAIAALPRGDVYLHSGARIPHILTTARWVHWYFSD
jgi:hypothetical protein